MILKQVTRVPVVERTLRWRKSRRLRHNWAVQSTRTVGNTTNDVEIGASFAALGKDTKDCGFDNFPRTSPPLFLHHLKSVVELASSQFISPLLHFLFVASQPFGLSVRSTPFNNIATYTHLHTPL
jgi:hypothetical protein